MSNRIADGWAQLDRDEAKMFRVKYGDGRVSEVVESATAARELLDDNDCDSHVQYRDGWDWRTYRGR